MISTIQNTHKRSRTPAAVYTPFSHEEKASVAALVTLVLSSCMQTFPVAMVSLSYSFFPVLTLWPVCRCLPCLTTENAPFPSS